MIVRIDDGTRFAVLGNKPHSPAPVVFLFALDCETTLTEARYSRVGQLLASRGYVCVSLDMPCHGEDAKQEEPTHLAGWRMRADRGENFVAQFTDRASAVLDYLIREHYADARKVAACGTSRGGFMAVHFAAADSRVGCAVGFSPVTDLLMLREFEGSPDDGLAAALSLSRASARLVGRPLWICIGNNDSRVSTESALSFASSLARSSREPGEPAMFEIHVMYSEGHHTPNGAHEMAAEWIQRQLAPANPGGK